MAKAIIDVEINDSAWKTFNQQVEAHKATLKKMPGQWGAIGKAVGSVTGAAAKFAAKIQLQAKAFKAANTMAGKLAVSMKATDRIVSSIARNTISFARHIKDATRSILSWSAVLGLFSGLLGAGGLFGIARMASSVSQGSTTAMGSGSSYGGQKAAEISYGQALGGTGGVQSLLNQIAQAQHSGGVMFGRLGMSRDQWQGKQASDVLGPMLQALQQAYRHAPKGAEKQAMETLAPGMDFNTLLRINSMNVGSMRQQYEARKRELSLSGGTQSAYRRFEQALDTAAEKIENLLANAIVPLLPALQQFTSGLLKAAGMLLRSPLVKKMIGGAGKALEAGAAYILSDQFSTDFKSFMQTMEKVADAVVTTAAFLNKWLGIGKQTTVEREADEMRKYNNSGGPNPTFPKGYVPGTLDKQIPGQSFNQKVDVNVLIHQPAGSNLFTSSHAAATGGSR